MNPFLLCFVPNFLEISCTSPRKPKQSHGGWCRPWERVWSHPRMREQDAAFSARREGSARPSRRRAGFPGQELGPARPFSSPGFREGRRRDQRHLGAPSTGSGGNFRAGSLSGLRFLCRKKKGKKNLCKSFQRPEERATRPLGEMSRPSSPPKEPWLPALRVLLKRRFCCAGPGSGPGARIPNKLPGNGRMPGVELQGRGGAAGSGRDSRIACLHASPEAERKRRKPGSGGRRGWPQATELQPARDASPSHAPWLVEESQGHGGPSLRGQRPP